MKGKRIAILESRLGKQLVGLIEQRGAVAIHAPALAEVPDLDSAQIGALVHALQTDPAKLAIFQTGVGTRALFAATDALGLTAQLQHLLARMVVAARGPKPTAALRARGVRIDCSASEPHTTREMLAALREVPLRGERVIVQRYGVANAELDRALEALGAKVLEVPTYRWSLPPDVEPLRALVGAIERREIDAAVFTNAEQVRNLFAVAEQLGKANPVRLFLNQILVASIGPVASAALREAGVRVGLEAQPPKLGALLPALEAALTG